MNRNLSYDPNHSKKKKVTKGAPKQKSEFSPFKEAYERLEAESAPKVESQPKQTTEEEAEEAKKAFIPYRKKHAKSSRPRPKGCSFPIITVVICLAAILLLFNVFLKTTFGKVDNYKIDSSKMSVVTEDPNMADYQTIALFGVDNQDNAIHEQGSRTDSIILFCIDKKKRSAKLLSIYRDTYVSINGEYDKINAAYAYGGPELALSTINRNLDLNVEDFVTINFKALADAVDIVGGISLTVKSEKELENLNDYIGNMNKINGGDSPKFDAPASYPFTATFDGNQAVAYSRIRYMAGGDHERANHQRIVINALFKSMMMKPWTVMKFVDTVLPQCKTSLSSDGLSALTKRLVGCDIADSNAYPFEGHSVDYKYNGIYYGFPTTVRDNVILAHEYLFGSKDYRPSEELERISEKVYNITQTFSEY